MGKSPATVVRDGLKVYADRGIFRDFTETAGRNGKIKFAFLLFDSRVTVEFAERDHTLVIRDMLPRVPADMYADLKDFLEELFDRNLPPHRRIDRRSADVRLVKRRGEVSLVVKVRSNRYRYGVAMLVSLFSWVRAHLQQWHPDYLWEVLGESEG